MRIATMVVAFWIGFLRQLSLAQPVSGTSGADRHDWPTAKPEQVGLSRSILRSMEEWLDGWREGNVHAVLVARHGKLIFERYFTGSDENLGQPIDKAVFGPEAKHDVRSVTKSITALVLGVVIDRGWVQGVDAPVLTLLPQFADLRTPEKDRITLHHLLTMSDGLEWHQLDVPYGDAANSEGRLYHAADRYRYVLDQPVIAPPGTIWNYNSGSTEIIGLVMRQATGKPLDELARTLLFEPLGIYDVEWGQFADGNPGASALLRMRPRDLAKIGQLVLQRGTWKGKQIIPRTWIDTVTRPHIGAQGSVFYGYQFWLGRSLVNGRQVDWSAGYGLGGQRVFIVPACDLVIVVNAGLYKKSSLEPLLARILNLYVLPATERGTYRTRKR